MSVRACTISRALERVHFDCDFLGVFDSFSILLSLAYPGQPGNITSTRWTNGLCQSLFIDDCVYPMAGYCTPKAATSRFGCYVVADGMLSSLFLSVILVKAGNSSSYSGSLSLNPEMHGGCYAVNLNLYSPLTGQVRRSPALSGGLAEQKLGVFCRARS